MTSSIHPLVSKKINIKATMPLIKFKIKLFMIAPLFTNNSASVENVSMLYSANDIYQNYIQAIYYNTLH